MKDGDVSRKPDLIAHLPKKRGEEGKEACHSLWADIPLAQTRTTSSPSSAQVRESAGVETLVHASSFEMAIENCASCLYVS